MKAIRVHQTGGPEVMRYEELPDPKPGPGEALVQLQAIGLNFIDIYYRTGVYPAQLPFTPGSEGAGTVLAVGPGVAEVAPGDRVAYAMVLGSYAERAAVPTHRLVTLPQEMDVKAGAAAMLQGMTAHYLVYSACPLKEGDTVLVHAAAGGVGLLLVQLAKRRGARVLATVSTVEKAQLAREAGADLVIRYAEEDFEQRVKEATGGRGVQVVYESVGQITFDKSIQCLATRGCLVLFGQSSGMVPPRPPDSLRRGSLFLTRPGLADYTRTREELLWRAGDVFRWIRTGELKLRVSQTLPLAEAAQAHRALADRVTTGKVLLIP
jgi:NADPH2:quinone reductase